MNHIAGAETTSVDSSTSGVFMDEVWNFLIATKAELILFCAAVVAYMLLFGNLAPKGRRAKGSKGKHPPKIEGDADRDEALEPSRPLKRSLPAAEARQLERDFRSAFGAGDHRQALRCWAALRSCLAPPAVSLAHAVESMQRLKKDKALVFREITAYASRYTGQLETSTFRDLLESLAKRLDSELVEKVMELMADLGMKSDQRTFEVLLSMHFSTRNLTQVKVLLDEMSANGAQLTTKARIVAVKTALKLGNSEEAKRHFRNLRELWEGSGTHGGEETPSAAPRHIISQLVELACKDRQLEEFLPLLDGVPLSEDAANSMLSECARRKDSMLTKRIEKLVRAEGSQLSDANTTLLVKSLTPGDMMHAQDLFNEMIAKDMPLSTDFVMALLTFCAQSRSMELADRLLEHAPVGQVVILSAFIRFFCESEQYEKACDVYEAHLRTTGRRPPASSSASGEAPTAAMRSAASAASGAAQKQQPLILDSRIERALMAAALRCGRRELAKNFLDASPSDVPKHIAMIRNCASSGNLLGAMEVFETLKSSGTEVNSIVFNTVLDACVECRDLKAAERWMARTKEAGLADVVSYNTLIKAYLQSGGFSKARALIDEMRSEGLQPNRVTFNELVNGLVARGSPAQRSEIWAIVREMRETGVKPNQVTCSILLKGLNSHSKEKDVLETMDLITDMEEPMDEVLLSSVVEACVRIGKPDLLTQKLKQLQGVQGFSVNGSHTFGSLIKAYGHARDMDGVWRCWKEMRTRHIRPTSITLGCMVEAVVSNGDTEGAHELIHQIREDDHCRDALNAVIYCSVLKGFTREKKIQRVWAVYEEMLSCHVDLSVVTYNTLLDACARCGRMDKVPAVVEDMRSKGIEPNLITYSTMVKGHCQAGDIERGFALLEEMKAKGKFKPDEIMFNSLLDGCAQNCLAQRGLALLDRMESEGVAPSNFTLSLLVKLMNRCRKLDAAFDLVRDISSKYNFKPNVHVYTNLIQACVTNRSLPSAMSTFNTMLKEKIRPESRAYAILARASLMQNQPEQAAALIRAAIGIRGAAPFVAEEHMSSASVGGYGLDTALIGEVLQGLTEKGYVHDLAVPLISDIRHYRPSIRLDPGVQRRLMSAGMAQDAQRQLQPQPQHRAEPVGSRQGRSTGDRSGGVTGYSGGGGGGGGGCGGGRRRQ